MKTMKLSFRGLKKVIQGKTIAVLITAALFTPLVSAAQDERQADDYDDQPATQSSTSGPWGNSAGSTIGSAGNAASEGTARPADPRLNSGSAAARPAAGPTPDATGGPGGNPDVPFDPYMNLAFLAGGVAFAYVAYRRRLKLKAVTAEK